VSLPDLGLGWFAAKIDTGARTTALHATEITPYLRAGVLWVRFRPDVPDGAGPYCCHAELVDKRGIKNTSGVRQDRIVIRTHLQLGDRRFPIEISLTDRSDMTFPMIIGRSALRRRGILIDCGRSWLTDGVRASQATHAEGATP
jgi:hypothetical protein